MRCATHPLTGATLKNLIMDALEEIAAAANSRLPIKGPSVYRWLKDDRSDVLKRLTTLLIESPARFDVDGLDWALEGVVPFLVQTAGGDRKFESAEDALTPFDALEDLKLLFRVLWRGREKSPSGICEVRERHLARIRDALAQLVADWPSPSADRVVTAVLEHLFANPEIRTYFDGWAEDPQLKGVHREACELSSMGEL